MKMPEWFAGNNGNLIVPGAMVRCVDGSYVMEQSGSRVMHHTGSLHHLMGGGNYQLQVVATGCVLPTDQDHNPKPVVNDTIVYDHNSGRVFYVYSKFLELDTKGY